MLSDKFLCFMVSFRQCQKKLILGLCGISLLVILAKIWHMPKLKSGNFYLPTVPPYGKLSVHNVKDSDLRRSNLAVYEAPKFSQLSTCPACFGYRTCREIDMGSLIFHGEMPNTHNNRISWKKAVLKDERILVSSPSADEWTKFDEFVCRNSSQNTPCDLSSAIRKTLLASEEILSPQNIRNLYQLMDPPQNKIIIPMCASKKLIEELKKTFDDDFDGYLSKEEQLMLFTCLLMQPGYVVMKFQMKTAMNMPIPNLLGACGRSILLEGGLTPLKEYLKTSFDIRAGLAVQVLQLVEDFEDEDSQWYFMYTDFSLESLVVTKDGEVIVMDLDELVILDKFLFPPGYLKPATSNELCNIACFQKATQEMLYNSNASVCSQVLQYSQLMYAIVCKQVLSDLKEHKSEGFFNFDGHKVHKKAKYPGLLHSIPLSDKEHIEDLLRECVQETSPNSRLRAVEELREILENHVNPDEVIENNSHTKMTAHSFKKIKGRFGKHNNEEMSDEYTNNNDIIEN